MILTSLKVCNFRSLKYVKLRFDKLTVLIGENDAGKSSTLDLLEMILGNRRPDANDFFYREKTQKHADGESTVKKISSKVKIIAEFKVSDARSDLLEYANDGIIRICKKWSLDTHEVLYWGSEVVDPDLAQDFTKLKKADLERIIQSQDPSALSELKTNEDKARWLTACAQKAPRRQGWLSVPKHLLEALPRFERYRAIDYSNPNSLVIKTLRQVYEQVIFKEVNENGHTVKKLDKRLSEVKADAEKEIKQKVQELSSFIKRYAPRIQDVSYDPIIDFGGGLRDGEFLISDGRGFHYLSKLGDGTKRRIFMATTEWDRFTTMQQIAKSGPTVAVIRGYDEPDTNLHYEAQRKMYQAIAEIADASNGNIQMVLCTHSLTMIDRAPAKNINLLRLKGGCTTVDRLQTEDDPNVELFLTELASEMGITNTVMFYERCFILIEGETEANALPMFYRTLYLRSLLEDGIRIINVKGNGATKEFLRLLGKNRQQITIAFMDRDTETEDRGERSKLTRDEFKQAGFSDEFIQERLLYIGEKEFEDAFKDEVIAEALNIGYPKPDEAWRPDEIVALRESKKISDALGRIVYQKCGASSSKWGKPELGKCLGRACASKDKIPREIESLFDLARKIVGITE